ncbi:MAG: hypothetical protein M0R74_20285 [Dehalococcoidia bacterium]|nr:hypothetical protein [Dehalococcoidia bacterium]
MKVTKKIFVPSSWQYNGQGTVLVESESVPGQNYFVGLRSLKCSCPHAMKGHLCKHGRWVAENRNTIIEQGKGGLFSHPKNAGETGEKGESK